MHLVEANLDLKPKEIISKFEKEYGFKVSYKTAWRATELAVKKIRESFEKSFNDLYDYSVKLHNTNPGTRIWLVRMEDNCFVRYFWSLGACIEAFRQSLRPLIDVDVMHLCEKYPGVLSVAITQDGNHILFVIAFGMAESVDYNTWTWFFTYFDESVGQIPNLVLVSNKMKSLPDPVHDLFKDDAKHCFCVRHISQNLNERFHDKGVYHNWWRTTKVTRPVEWENWMENIREINGPTHTYIMELDPTRWSNVFIEARRYDMLTSNITECTNNLFKGVRAQSITIMVETIREKLVSFFETCYELSLQCITRLTPWAKKYFNDEASGARSVHCMPGGSMEFQVKSIDFTDVVHLDLRICTCRKWLIMGLPCTHTMAAIKLRRLNPYDFVEPWYFNSTWRSTYNEIIHPIQDIS